MSEADLFHRLSEDRLRGRCLWGGIAIAASVLVPYEVIDNQPQFIWALFGELPPAAVVAAVAPFFAGLALVLANRFSKRPASLGMVSLAALLAIAIAQKLGADAAAWGILPLPQSFAGRSTVALFAMALTSAGCNLAYRAETRRASRYALWSGMALALAFYAWPGRGEAPGVTVARNLAALPEMPTVHFQIGLITLATIALWPGIVAALGLIHLRRPPERGLSVLSMVAVFGFPLILMMLLFSWYMRTSPGAALFGALGAAAEITAILAVASAALEVLGQALFGDRPEALPAGWAPSRAAAGAGAMLAVLGVTQAWLARPPDKGVDWPLGDSSAEADELFRDAVVAWSAERWRWDTRVRDASSSRELIELKARGKAMVELGERIDPNLGAALAALAKAGHRLDTSSRGWYRLVAEVNDASRAARLPYYLDPRVSVETTKDGIIRRFIVDSYRVETARRFDVGGERHAVLHVRTFGSRRGGHFSGLLGFSRDVQPFALLVLDENTAHLEELEERLRDLPVRCGEVFEAEADAVMRRCGALLSDLFGDRAAAEQALLASVERHELQHQIDGPLLPIAGPVLKKLGAYDDTTRERVNRELSAYLAQLTMTAPRPKIGLVLPLRFVLMNERGIYHHAGVLMYEALVDRSIRKGQKVDPARAGEAFDELERLDEAALRQRAREAWERLFDADLPPVVALDEATG